MYQHIPSLVDGIPQGGPPHHTQKEIPTDETSSFGSGDKQI